MYWKKDATAADVEAMPVSVAKAIYKSKYWDALACDDLPAGIDYTVFDYGVNSGIHRAGKILKRVLKMDDSDWSVAAYINAINDRLSVGNIPAVIDAINHERLNYLQSLKTWEHFGKGWGARVRSVESFSQQLNSKALTTT
jgi:lysozyme family protein